MIRVDPQIEEALDVQRSVAVGPHERRGVGILDLGQSGGTLEANQLIEVQSHLVADLARGHIRAVIAEGATGGKQHRGEGIPDLLDGDALIQ